MGGGRRAEQNFEYEEFWVYYSPSCPHPLNEPNYDNFCGMYNNRFCVHLRYMHSETSEL